MNIVDRVECQIIAAVRTESELGLALQSQVSQVFLLFGHLVQIAELVDRIKSAGKEVYLHFDLIAGLATDRSGMEYTAQRICPTGVISTRTQLIGLAREHGLMTIQRLFLIDSAAVDNGLRLARSAQPDAIEVMPGLMPDMIRKITDETELPVIAGGLIQTEDQVHAALQAGALAVTAGSPHLWQMTIR